MVEILPSIAYLKRPQAERPKTGDFSRALQAQSLCGSSAAAQRAWHLLDSPQTLETLTRSLVREYHFDAERCGAELRSLLERLLREDLIQISPDT